MLRLGLGETVRTANERNLGFVSRKNGQYEFQALDEIDMEELNRVGAVFSRTLKSQRGYRLE